MNDRPEPVNPSRERTLSQHPERLRYRRRAAGLSIRQAAVGICSAGHLSDLEHGNYSAGPEILAGLAQLYDCRITDLMPPEPPVTAEAEAAIAAELAMPWSLAGR